GSRCYRPTCFHNTDIEVDMNKLIFESKNMYTATEPAACGGTRAIIHMDSGYLIETDDPETLILSMNVTKELLQKILRERYEDAT
ncbi:TPA: hypothetical protein ACS778_003855, partial [Providencia alcalifaciens]